jgi:hypothetical protein
MYKHKVLLLNASNMAAYPVYPYTFIQVPAVARQAGIQVVCKDLLGIPQEDWGTAIQALIELHGPEMILITLRNTDSFVLKDYESDKAKQTDGNGYFPIESTQALITCLRAVTHLKIAIGGFGFSLLAYELMHYFRPDVGMFGGAEAFFSNFEAIRDGHYAGIANLLYFQADQLIQNPYTFEAPLAGPEYTSQVIEEMMAFYNAFPSPGFDGAPVEVIRGCSHVCVFCAVPHVKGRQVQYRHLAAVMADIQILVDQGITRIYMISAELNPDGNEFMLQLADRIRAFNAAQAEGQRITWYGANYLLTLEPEAYERLYASGFTGGLFDITALDDRNARAMHTPYRNQTLLKALKTYAQYRKIQPAFMTERKKTACKGGDKGDGPLEEKTVEWTMFLGNPATTAETIRNTLRVANQEGLAQTFQACSLNRYWRVFDYENPDPDTLGVTFSITPDLQRTHYQQRLPSFAYPPALLQNFGSEEAIERLFDYIAQTYLSTKYRETRDWRAFIRQKATPESVASWVAVLAKLLGIQVQAVPVQTATGESPADLAQLFADETQEKTSESCETLAKQVADSLLSAGLAAFPDRLEALGLPATRDQLEQMTPYALAVAVYSRWDTEKGLLEALERQTGPVLSEPLQGFIRFSIQAMLYRFNILVLPEYKTLFVNAG